MHSLFSTSHSLISPPPVSLLQSNQLDLDAKSLPSGEKLTEFTLPVCPPSVAMHSLLSTSHSLIVLSLDADAKSLPSGEKQRECALPVCPSSVAMRSLFSTSQSVIVPGPEAKSLPSGEKAMGDP